MSQLCTLLVIFAFTPSIKAAERYEQFAKRLRFQVSHEESEEIKAAVGTLLKGDHLKTILGKWEQRTSTKASKVYNPERVRGHFTKFYKDEFKQALSQGTSEAIADCIRFPLAMSSTDYTGDEATNLDAEEFSEKHVRNMGRKEFLKKCRRIFTKELRLLLINKKPHDYYDHSKAEYANKIEFSVTVGPTNIGQEGIMQTFIFGYFVEPISRRAYVKLEGILNQAPMNDMTF